MTQTAVKDANDQNLDDELAVDDSVPSDEAAFVTYDIAAYPSDYTLSVLEHMWKDGDILVPVFQRKFVWKIEQSSLLIESLLMGLPVPQAFFFVDADSRYLVIDGLQRIMSIVYFFSGYFGDENYQGKKAVFRLTGLNEKSPFAGKTFGDLSEPDKRKLRNSVLRVINVKQLGPKEDDTSAYHIFERLNTGGTPLKAQEIRNCVFHGPLVSLLSKLNLDANWRKILGKKNLDKHQKDIELLLRVLAFSLRANEYEKPMKEFLNKTMAHYRDASSPDISRFSARFGEVCAQVIGELGEKPFHPKGRVNASALDAVMGTVISLDKTPSNLRERYENLLAEPKFLGTLSVSTSDLAVVKQRLEVVRQYMV